MTTIEKAVKTKDNQNASMDQISKVIDEVNQVIKKMSDKLFDELDARDEQLKAKLETDVFDEFEDMYNAVCLKLDIHDVEMDIRVGYDLEFTFLYKGKDHYNYIKITNDSDKTEKPIEAVSYSSGRIQFDRQYHQEQAKTELVKIAMIPIIYQSLDKLNEIIGQYNQDLKTLNPEQQTTNDCIIELKDLKKSLEQKLNQTKLDRFFDNFKNGDVVVLKNKRGNLTVKWLKCDPKKTRKTVDTSSGRMDLDELIAQFDFEATSFYNSLEVGQFYTVEVEGSDEYLKLNDKDRNLFFEKLSPIGGTPQLERVSFNDFYMRY